MTPRNEDYDLVARYLDGEPLELTAEQKALAEEIASDFAVVGPALDAAPPGGMLHRVSARIRHAGRPKARVLKWRVPLAAAAGLVIATLAGILWLHNGGNGILPADVAVRELLKNPDPGLRAEIDAAEIDLAAAQAVVTGDEPSDLELALVDVAEQIETVIEENEAADDEAAWRAWLQNL